MKSIGIVRKMDDLGRVVIPMEFRRTMELEPGTPMEIYVTADSIVFRKYQPGCSFCGSFDIKVDGIRGKRLCRSCTLEVVNANVYKS